MPLCAIKINQPYCAVATGGVLLVGTGPLITVDEDPLWALEIGDGGEMLLSINLIDKQATPSPLSSEMNGLVVIVPSSGIWNQATED